MDNFADLLLTLKSLLGIEDVNTARDEELTAYLNGAIVACERYLDNKISRGPVTEVWARECAPLMLRYWYPDNLTAVTLDGVDETADWKLIAHAGFSELHRDDGSAYTINNQELKATYEAGFSSCPYDLMLAICYCAMKIERDFSGEMSVAGASIVKESVTGIGSAEYDIADAVGLLPPQTTQILDLYRGERLG